MGLKIEITVTQVYEEPMVMACKVHLHYMLCIVVWSGHRPYMASPYAARETSALYLGIVGRGRPLV